MENLDRNTSEENSPSDNDFVQPSSVSQECCSCRESFSTKYSYYKHKEICKEVKPTLLYPRKCDKCKVEFEDKVKFFRHKKKCGGETEAQVDTPKVVYPRECGKCHNTFQNKVAFSRHHKVQCTEEGYTLKTNKHTQCIHPGCTLTFYHRTAMIDHLIKDHAMAFKISNLSFTSMAEFIAWKSQVEAETWTCFTSPCGAKGDH